jgi:hypothetical protein
VAHVTTSVALIGAVAAFLILAIAGVTGSPPLAAAAYPAMRAITWFLIMPLALSSLVIGLLESVGTSWGLYRHYWVVWKLVITVVAVAVLIVQLRSIDSIAIAAAGGVLAGTDLIQQRVSLIVHSTGGIIVLLLPVLLSVYKPRGTTRYWRRRIAAGAD